MTLVDTSVWIGHFRKTDAALVRELDEGRVATHPFIVGELACGNFKDRSTALEALRKLPQTPVAEDAEVSDLLETYRLWDTGLGWVDLHILAAAATTGWRLLTADIALQRAATKIGLPHA